MFKPAPITENESKELLFDSYVTYINTHQCAACGSIETFSQCFEVWLHPTKSKTSSFRDLRPVVGTSLKPMNMAVIRAPARMVPICHHCATRYRVQGRPEQVAVAMNNDAWHETLRRKAAAAAPPAEVKVANKSATAPSKVVPRLDQI